MLFRTALIILVLCCVFVFNELNKNNGDTSIKTIGSKQHNIDKNKKKLIKGKPSFCKLSRDMGPCRAAKHRFYYDSATNECKCFTYGGCRGNQNNFRSLHKCQKTCKV
ncbi:unnamed protein product [Adineta steineri]|uniref:BPTI/Kunitz inhibitor domain-containing protein n=1 Tax=Adineta steineri TaxID=433720 RepID=A0A815Q7T4_9BILA|nr:unnamed protein product [Adineta steineri]